MSDLIHPFRAADPTLRLAALRAEREELLTQREQLKEQLRVLRPWMWSRFLVGIGLAVGFVVLMAVSVLVMISVA